ncbi:MAG: response regulator [Bryobacteraceae bacterium]
MERYDRVPPSETILVVEDGDAVRNLVCRMLVQNGFHVLEARDGQAALEICESEAASLHLVLTDLVMPHMSGGELACRLAHMRPDLRILFMSGYPQEPLVQRLGRDRAIFIQKPFTSVTLVEAIRRTLDAPWDGLPVGRKAGA